MNQHGEVKMGHVMQPALPNGAFAKGHAGMDYRPTPDEKKAALARLSAARLKLAIALPFFGHMALRLRLHIAEPEQGVPSAAVAPDGTTWWNYRFLEALTESELLGVICHEVLHPVMMHFTRRGDREPRLFNVAGDLSFNLDIMDMATRYAPDKIALPPGVLFDEKYRGWTAEEIYEQLQQEQQDSRKGPQGQKGKGKGQGQSGPGGQPGEDGDVSDMRPDLCETEEGKRAAEGSAIHQKEQEASWKETLVTAAQKHEQQFGQGTLPAGIRKMVDELTNPVVEWTTVLSRWIGENGPRQDYSYRRPGRRSVPLDTVLPSMQRYGVDDVTILWDSSGSQSGREAEILTEIGSMCEDLDLKLRVMICDAAIHADVQGVQSAVEAAEEYAGGGGSSFHPCFDKLREEGSTTLVIAFTDGYIAVPSEKPNTLRDVLWVLWDAHRDKDPTNGMWGTVLRVHADGHATFGNEGR